MGSRRAAGLPAITFAVILGAALAIPFGAARCACAQTAVGPKVRVCGVCIVGEGYENGDDVLRLFRWRKGTTVALLVTVPEGGLIAVNRDETKITRMADDRGMDLTVSSKEAAREPAVSRGSQVSADGKACLIEINGQKVPAEGADYIAVAGTISLKCGSKKEVGRKEKVELKPGTEFTVGGMKFTVSKTGKAPKTFELPKPDEAATETAPAFEVELRTDADWSDIAGIAFMDAAGKDLGARPGEISVVNARGRAMTAVKSFVLPQQADTATIVVTCWEEFKDLQVPFDLKTTVGIP